MDNNQMLSTNSAPFTISLSSSSVSCWPALEPSLNRLFSLPDSTPPLPALGSDDYLKLYTLVFDYCVGAGDNNKKGRVLGLNVSGEELYMTIVKYLETRFNQWSLSLKDNVLDNLLAQLDKLQAAEKPLTFIFTYLERHWIDRQINEPRVDVLPMKQLIWSMWDEIVLKRVWPLNEAINLEIGEKLRAIRGHAVPLEELESVAKFVHYLRVISKPTHLESDYMATRRVMMAGAVINPRAQHPDRFKQFVQWYCGTIELDCPNLVSLERINEFIQASLQFWYEEEGRMAFLRFDKGAQITVRNHLKSLLLLPNLVALRAAFKQSILNWNILDSNSIYRLLANRKSLLIQLDCEAEIAFHQKGMELLRIELASLASFDEIEHCFISVLGQYYSNLTEIIQTSFASRSELFEARSRAFRSLFNDPPLPSNVNKKSTFSAKSLAKFADYLIRNCPENWGNNLEILVALFRLIDNKDEFQETFCQLLSLRLLSSGGSKSSTFERNLLKELETVCGSFYIKPFERMYSDINGDYVSGLTVITGGTWNLNTKILPGNAILLNPADKYDWPVGIGNEIGRMGSWYLDRHPKKKLYFSPLLTWIEFEYFCTSGRSVVVKGTSLHLSILQHMASGPVNTGFDSDGLVSKYGQYALLVLKTLLTSGLIINKANSKFDFGTDWQFNSNESFRCVDLYSLTLNELVFGGQEVKFNKSNSARSTPHPNFTPGPNHVETLSPVDKSILLQCTITRLMKQLRTISLPDLFSRLSMLPKLLTRFSPSLEDLVEALRQLHEKEFVVLARGDGVDEVCEIGREEMKRNEKENEKEFDRDNLWIKYLA